MLNVTKINAQQASSYFEKSQDYYTKHMTSYDRWQGALAKTLGLKGELTKEAFDKLSEHLQSVKRDNPAFFDCTMSAPKSVSLALAAGEQTRLDMIHAHQAAVAQVRESIEANLLGVKVRHEAHDTHNALFADFLHTTARPTKENGFVPDLDLHDHLLLANMTIGPDGKEHAIDARKLMNSRAIKEYGLRYRQVLAHELQERGYQLEVTDEKNGYFELKGFDREIIEEYSHRRLEVVQTAKEHGITDMQKANKLSRTAKDKAVAGEEEILAQTKAAIFDSGRVKIEKEESHHERNHDSIRRENDEVHRERGSEVREHRSGRRLQDAASPLFDSPRILQDFAGQPEAGVRDMQERGLDVNEGKGNDESALLLSNRAIDYLAKCQSAAVRRVFMREARTVERRERLKEIDRITRDTIEDMTSTDYAIALPTLKHRIRAAAVLMNLSEREIEKAIDRAGLVAIGRRRDPKTGKLSKDRYLTTRKILEIEPRITERVGEGKGVIKDAMTNERARAALAKVEDFEAQKKHGVAGDGLFQIAGGEQGEAVIHALTCRDRFLAIDGLAGTGKTTLMQRMKWIADDEGIEIKGLCFTGKAAAGLQDESGIESTTIHSFLNQLEKQSKRADRAPVLNRALDTPLARDIEAVREARQQDGIKQEWDFSHVKPAERREVWIVDEAGLVDMKLMDQLQKAAIARNAQIVFSGDPKQLPPVGIGEPLKDMEKAGMATAYLQEIRRQRKADADVREAVKESVVGDTDKALDLLDKRGDVREIAELDDRRAAIVRTMTEEPFEKYNESLLLVSRNIDRKFYNKAIRAEFVKRGDIEQGTEYEITVKNSRKADTIEKRFFAEHDRIIFKANDKKLSVKNGEMASIKSIDGSTFVAVKDNGEEVTFDISRYSTLDHAYSVTNYAAQGMTVRRVVADMDTRSAKQTRNSFYVDISRTKDTAVVFTNDKAELKSEVRDFAKKARGEDFENVADIQRRGIQNNDQYKTSSQTLDDRLARALRDIEEQSRRAADDTLKRATEALNYIAAESDRKAEVRRAAAQEQEAVVPTASEPERASVADATEASRPQPAHETAPIRADDSPEPAEMSTSRGIGENSAEKERPESPASLSERSEGILVPAENQKPPRGADIQQQPEPVFVPDTATAEAIEAAEKANLEARTELYNKTRDAVAPQFDLRNDKEYAAIRETAASAAAKAYDALEAQKKAERDRGDKYQAWRQAEQKDREHDGFLSRIGYTKQAPAASKAFKRAQDAEDAARRQYEAAAKEREAAERGLRDYQQTNEYRIRAAIYKRSPRLHDFDKAIEQNRRARSRAVSRAREKNQTFERD